MAFFGWSHVRIVCRSYLPTTSKLGKPQTVDSRWIALTLSCCFQCFLWIKLKVYILQVKLTQNYSKDYLWKIKMCSYPILTKSGFVHLLLPRKTSTCQKGRVQLPNHLGLSCLLNVAWSNLCLGWILCTNTVPDPDMSMWLFLFPQHWQEWMNGMKCFYS